MRPDPGSAGAVAARILGVLALLAGSTLIALGLGEVAARLAWHEPESARRLPPPVGLRELHYAQELTQPRVQGIYSGAFYRANSSGFRGPDYAREKPTGVFRIVIAGDSVTMGSGVTEEEAYPHLLEVALNGAAGAERYEVLNVGLIGLDIDQVVTRIEAVGLPFDPNLIVYGCTLNDINGPDYRKSMGPNSRIVQLGRYHRFAGSRSYLLRVLWPRWESLQDLVHPRRGTWRYEMDDNYFHNPPAWQHFLAGLDRLASISRTRHVPAVVFIHTWPEYLNVFHPYRRIYDTIGRAAEERGLPAIDSLPEFRGHDEISLWVSMVDSHPNAAGHRLLARALLDGLEHLPSHYLHHVDAQGTGGS